LVEKSIHQITENLKNSRDKGNWPMISQIREPLSKIVQPLIIFFAKLGIHPTVFTVIGLLLSITSAVFIALNNFLTAFIIIWFAGAMDFIDGGVARYNKLDSMKGSFIDSIADRLSDVAVFSAVVIRSIYIEPNDKITIGVGIVMVASTLLISYIRAKGESIGIKKMAVGLMERGERFMLLMILMFVGVLVPDQGFITPPPGGMMEAWGLSYFSIGYMILTALCVITVIQRFVHVSILLTKAETTEDVQAQK